MQLDDKNIKAYFLMAETLVEIAMNSKDKTKIEEAIEKLKKCIQIVIKRSDSAQVKENHSSKSDFKIKSIRLRKSFGICKVKQMSKKRRL